MILLFPIDFCKTIHNFVVTAGKTLKFGYVVMTGIPYNLYMVLWRHKLFNVMLFAPMLVSINGHPHPDFKYLYIAKAIGKIKSGIFQLHEILHLNFLQVSHMYPCVVNLALI